MWTEHAACKGNAQYVFFPEGGNGTGDAAKLICAGCPVRDECLDFAIRTEQEHGIWGGMNPRERREFEDNTARNKGRSSGRINGEGRLWPTPSATHRRDASMVSQEATP